MTENFQRAVIADADALLAVRAQAWWAFKWWAANPEIDTNPLLNDSPYSRLEIVREAQALLDDLEWIFCPTI